jgi:uncharacterized membrane protein YagU involved in acid resistance
VRCGFAIDGVGLIPTCITIGMPVVMPPRMPPAWFVSVTIVPPSEMVNASLCSEPRIFAA